MTKFKKIIAVFVALVMLLPAIPIMAIGVDDVNSIPVNSNDIAIELTAANVKGGIVIPRNSKLMLTLEITGADDIIASGGLVKYYHNDNEISEVSVTSDGILVTAHEGINTVRAILFNSLGTAITRSEDFCFEATKYARKELITNLDLSATSSKPLEDNHGANTKKGTIIALNSRIKYESITAGKTLFVYEITCNDNSSWFWPVRITETGEMRAMVYNDLTRANYTRVDNIANLKSGTWYNLQLILNTEANQMLLSLDGTLIFADKITQKGDVKYIKHGKLMKGHSWNSLEKLLYASLFQYEHINLGTDFQPDMLTEAEDVIKNVTMLEDLSASSGYAVALRSGASAKTKATKTGNYRAHMLVKGSGSFKLNGNNETVSADDGYKWYSCTPIRMESGDANLSFSDVNGSISLDRIVLITPTGEETVAPKTWAAPNRPEAYPQLIDYDSIGTVAPFKAGDKVAFIGDSVTHYSYYPSELMSYYATHYPDVEFTYFNKGIAGSYVSGATNRLKWDICKDEFNIAVILLGINDLERAVWYKKSTNNAGEIINSANNDTNIYSRITSLPATIYNTDNAKRLIQELENNNKDIERIILAAPTMYDEWAPKLADRAPSFNNSLRTSAARLYNHVATKRAAGDNTREFIDFNTPQLKAKHYNLAKNPDFVISKDCVHPNRLGDTIMTYTFLKYQGENGLVSEVGINAADGRLLNNEKADVSDISVSGNTVSYTYKPKAMPIAADSTYRDAEAVVPMTDELNREIIRVTGLENGNYDIKFNGVTLVTASAESLNEGVNVADLENNPAQATALAIKAYTDAKKEQEYDSRDFALKYQIGFNSGKYKADDSVNEAQKLNTDGAYDNFILDKLKDISRHDIINTYEAKIYELNNNIGTYSVSITPTNNVVTDVKKTDVVDYPTPDFAYNISPQRPTEKLIAGGVENVNGKVGVRVENRFASADARAVSLFVAKYNADGDELLSISPISYELNPGEEKLLTSNVDYASLDESYKMFLWDSDTVAPMSLSFDFKNPSLELEGIYIDGKLIEDFESTKDSYTIYLDNLEFMTPYVEAIAKNSTSSVSVVHGGAFLIANPTPTSTITVTAPGNSSRTITVEFVRSELPKLTSIMIGGEPIEDFSPDKYTYTTTKSGEVTAQTSVGNTFVIGERQDDKVKIVVSPKKNITRTYTITFN